MEIYIYKAMEMVWKAIFMQFVSYKTSTLTMKHSIYTKLPRVQKIVKMHSYRAVRYGYEEQQLKTAALYM